MAEGIKKKVLATRRKGKIEYELTSLNDGELFVIYEWDSRIKGVHRIPEVFQSRNEKEVKDYFEAL